MKTSKILEALAATATSMIENARDALRENPADEYNTRPITAERMATDTLDFFESLKPGEMKRDYPEVKRGLLTRERCLKAAELALASERGQAMVAAHEARRAAMQQILERCQAEGTTSELIDPYWLKTANVEKLVSVAEQAQGLAFKSAGRNEYAVWADGERIGFVRKDTFSAIGDIGGKDTIEWTATKVDGTVIVRTCASRRAAAVALLNVAKAARKAARAERNAEAVAVVDGMARKAGVAKRECLGHPAGANDPMGETVYCDGRCRAASPIADATIATVLERDLARVREAAATKMPGRVTHAVGSDGCIAVCGDDLNDDDVAADELAKASNPCPDCLAEVTPPPAPKPAFFAVLTDERSGTFFSLAPHAGGQRAGACFAYSFARREEAEQMARQIGGQVTTLPVWRNAWTWEVLEPEGIEFLRAAVAWANSEPEDRWIPVRESQKPTVAQILDAYRAHLAES